MPMRRQVNVRLGQKHTLSARCPLYSRKLDIGRHLFDGRFVPIADIHETIRSLFFLERVAREIQGARAHGVASEVRQVDLVVDRPELFVRPPHAKAVDKLLVVNR